MGNHIGRINYGFTEWRCGIVPIVATNNSVNILLNSTNSTSAPHKLNAYKHALLRKITNIITFKDNIGSTGNYIWDKYKVILNNIQPPNTAPELASLKTPLSNQHILTIYLSRHYQHQPLKLICIWISRTPAYSQ